MTPWTSACQASLSISSSQSLLKLMSIKSVMPSNHLILCCPLLLLPSIFPSTRVFPMGQFFTSGGQKYWTFSFHISPSNEYSGLISFRMEWFDLLAVRGILKSLLQHHSSKASTLWCSALFMVQLSHPYMTTGNTIALTRWTFVGKVTSDSLKPLTNLKYCPNILMLIFLQLIFLKSSLNFLGIGRPLFKHILPCFFTYTLSCCTHWHKLPSP